MTKQTNNNTNPQLLKEKSQRNKGDFWVKLIAVVSRADAGLQPGLAFNKTYRNVYIGPAGWLSG